MRNAVLAGALLGAAVAAGCAGSESDDGVGDARDVGSLGATHVYQVATPDGKHHAETAVVDQVSADGFRRRTTFTNSTDYTTHTYALDGGAQYLVESWRFTEGGESSWTYDPPALVHPADLGAGATATSVSTVTTTGPIPGTTTRSRQVTVDGAEQVAVPAGTFTALRTTTVDDAGTTVVQWWVAGRGRVKVVAFQTAEPASVTTWELVASSL